VRSVRVRTGSLHSAGIPRPGRVTGVAVASVVPEATKATCVGLRASGLKPYLVGPRTRTGLKFNYRRGDLGADRLCAAVGARRRFPDEDLVVFDFGTATTVNVILREGIFAGGAILPGVQMSLDALADNTAGLPRLGPGEAQSPIQHSTRAAMQAGVAGLFAGGIDRIIDEVERDTGRSHRIVATGGGTRAARRYSKRIGAWIPRLASEGLAEVFYFNNPASVDVGRKARAGNPGA
ncbi:MAG: type III pantothenate kinase, partial [candidate division WOR-3 bacterium]|nr:type III pantothenate kinase [candidate division WOR-3 bacterium]